MASSSISTITPVCSFTKICHLNAFLHLVKKKSRGAFPSFFILLSATSLARGSLSTPIYRQPSLYAASAVVPLPSQRSKTKVFLGSLVDLNIN